jgi:hypothetical protein
MKYKFIPVDNNIDKAIAFANSLDVNNIRNVQKIKTKEFYIPTLDVVTKLQNEGWQLKGVDEQRGKNRKISSNYVQMQHPDFAVKNSKGKDEAYTSITISNSCNGNKPLQMSLGMFRQVCTNGLVMFDQHAEAENIKHIEINYRNLDRFIASVTNKTGKLLTEVSEMKHKGLSIEDMRKLAREAASLRYNDLEDINIDDLLTVNRVEDESNDLWTVFNRIQENLTHDVNNMNEDIRLNKQLFSLANQYALAV